MSDIVNRLRSPSDNEDTMKVWDTIRSIIADGNRGSWPRDIFESILSHIDEEREEAADVISTLRDRCARLEKAVAACMVGGNHLSSQLVDRLGPGFATEYPPDMDPETALRRLCATVEYDMWVAWASCINARAALDQDKGATGE